MTQPVLDFGGAPERLMTVQEAASILRRTPDHIYRIVRQGVLPAIKIGRSVLISPSDLSKYIDQNRTVS